MSGDVSCEASGDNCWDVLLKIGLLTELSGDTSDELSGDASACISSHSSMALAMRLAVIPTSFGRTGATARRREARAQMAGVRARM